MFAPPQAVAFREPDQGVNQAQGGNLASMMVGGPGHRFYEQPRVMPLRVDAMPQQERVRDGVEVGMP